MREKINVEFLAKTGILLLFIFTLGVFFLFARSAPPSKEGAQALAKASQVPPQTVPSAKNELPKTSAQLLQEKHDAALTEVEKLAGKLEEAEQENELLKQAQIKLPENFSMSFQGEFQATAYCCEEYKHICGGNGVTASGTKPTPGITVAADWTVFAPGTWLYIEDVGLRRVEDSGSAIKGKRLDIAIDTHENALKWAGFGKHKVWVLEINETESKK